MSIKLEGLRQCCKSQGLDYRELAERSKCSYEHIRALAQCRTNASPQAAARIAIALGVSVPDLIKAPSVADLMGQLVNEIRLYREFCEQSQAEYGAIYDDITT